MPAGAVAGSKQATLLGWPGSNQMPQPEQSQRLLWSGPVISLEPHSGHWMGVLPVVFICPSWLQETRFTCVDLLLEAIAVGSWPSRFPRSLVSSIEWITALERA